MRICIDAARSVKASSRRVDCRFKRLRVRACAKSELCTRWRLRLGSLTRLKNEGIAFRASGSC